MNPLLLLGGLVVGLIFLLKSKPVGTGGGVAPPGPGPGGVPTIPAIPAIPTIPAIPGVTANGCIDPDMPPLWEETILQALATITNAAQLDQLAVVTLQHGYPQAATCLAAAADKVRGGETSGTGGGSGAGGAGGAGGGSGGGW